MYQEDGLEVRNLRRCVRDFPKLTAVRERLSEANSGAWRRVDSFWLFGFLGFPRGRPRSTSVGSVLTGEVLMCTDLIGRDTDCLGLRI